MNDGLHPGEKFKAIQWCIAGANATSNSKQADKPNKGPRHTVVHESIAKTQAPHNTRVAPQGGSGLFALHRNRNDRQLGADNI